jgi:hypothetical protein
MLAFRIVEEQDAEFRMVAGQRLPIRLAITFNRTILGAHAISTTPKRVDSVQLWRSGEGYPLFKNWLVVSCVLGSRQSKRLPCSGTVSGSDRLSNGPDPKRNRKSLDNFTF